MGFSEKEKGLDVLDQALSGNQNGKVLNSIVNISQKNEYPQRMSHRVIAEIIGKEPKHVKRDCDVMFKELGLNEKGYAQDWTHPQNNQTYIEYMLTRDLVETLITGYSIKLRHAVLNRWRELESLTAKDQKPVSLSRMDLIQLALVAEQENIELRGKVAVLAPKAEALDTIADTSNTYNIRECAKNIGIREKDLIQLLIEKKWIYRDSDRKLQPHAQYTLNKVFTNRASPVIVNKYDGQERVFLHMRVTAFGLTRITALVIKMRKLQQVAA